MKFNKLLIPAMFSLTLFSLTSCDIEGFIKDNASDAINDAVGDAINDIINNNTPTDNTETYIPVEIDAENIDYGYLDLQKYDEKKEQLISLYTEIDTVCSQFMTSSTTLTAQTRTIGGVDKNYYIIGDEISYSKYGLSYAEASAVYKTVVLDNPEYYFLDNTLLNSSMTTTDINGISTTKSSISLVCDPDYYRGSDRALYNQKLNEYKQTISNLVSTTTNPIEKTKIIHDYIITHGQYAFKADGTTPDDSSFAHNLLGLVVNQKGVCESYAELFQYLLMQNGIEAILVTGQGFNDDSSTGEAHAWNFVKFNFEEGEDIVSKWYGFDVTWDDPVPDSSIITPYSHKNFGKVNNDFKNSHVEDVNGNMNYGLSYLYALPTLADSDLL